MKYAVIENGRVANVVLWDGGPEWQPEDGQTLLPLAPDQVVGIGWTVSNGVVQAPPPPPPPPPPSVVSCSPWQLRAELRARGLLAAAQAVVAAAGPDAQDAFEYSTEYLSNNPMLLALGANMPTPLSASDIYNMIESASRRVPGVPA